MIPDKRQYKIGDQIIWGDKTAVIIARMRNSVVEVMLLKPRYPHDNTRYLELKNIKPIGYALIKPSAGGKFRYHTVSWNNEKLQTSEPLDDKNHVKRMARKYFPSFHIVDKTV